jgi:HSP20 family protein
LTKNKKNHASDPDGLSFPIDPKLDEALRRAVSEVLSKMAVMEPGAPITYSIDIRVDENGVPSALQSAGKGNAQTELQPTAARNPLVEVVEREKLITVTAEVAGMEGNALRVRATPMALEICSVGNGRSVDRVRVINLPKRTNPATAIARYRNGVLEVTVEKGMGTASRTVRVE